MATAPSTRINKTKVIRTVGGQQGVGAQRTPDQQQNPSRREQDRMKTAHEHVTMDGTELRLLERYEERFGETPPVYFLAPKTSKRLIIDALRRNRPFNEKDLKSASD